MPPRTRLIPRLCPPVAAVALALAGCGGAPNPNGAAGSSKPGTTITLYNAQHEQTTAALVAAFTKQTGIKVRVRNDGEDVLTAQIAQEGSRSPADVFYAENSNWLEQLAQRGLLAKVDAATLANVPGHDSAASGDWVGVSARVSALVYNPARLSPTELPKTVMGLASPTLKGKLELAPAETDFWPVVSSVARTYGQAQALKWLGAVKANAGGDANAPDTEAVVSDVSKGVADLGLINHYYFYRLQAEVGKAGMHASLAYFEPHDPGYVEDISGAAVLRSSQHQAAAQMFLHFLTSPAGQKVLADTESFEYPIHPGVAPSPALPPFTSFQPSSFTPAALGTGLDAENLLRQAGLI
jgi:iron(III) transport system substrate-binding protein